MQPTWQTNDGAIRLYQGDCLAVLPTLEAGSVDAVACDPPYGLGFMGKDWDHGIPGEHFWVEALRVAKPGAHLLAFGGTRTFHRLAVAIEDAGWQIRDCLVWCYGSGFPKSLDVSKAIDKEAGAEREVMAIDDEWKKRVGTNHGKSTYTDTCHGSVGPHGGEITTPATDAAKQWSGWGTALKPAVEYIILGRKPLTPDMERDIIVENLTKLEAQLWSLLPASVADNAFGLNQADYDAACGFAQWLVSERSNTQAALSVPMATSQFVSVMTSCLSIVRSWRSILAEHCGPMNTSTTGTESNTITDWKTLRSCLSVLTPSDIIKAALRQPGSWWLALPAARSFNAALVNIASTRERSAPDNAISSARERCLDEADTGLRLNWRPIILARKPLEGTVAQNVLKHGTGGLNIGGCRVATTDQLQTLDGSFSFAGSGGANETGKRIIKRDAGQGRWPANLIHDGSEEVLACFPQSTDGVAVCRNRDEGGARYNATSYEIRLGPQADIGYGGSGSAARFFKCCPIDDEDADVSRLIYVPKASREDREEGLEGCDKKPVLIGAEGHKTNPTTGKPVVDIPRGNAHPTVKPTALMRYLCKLITPPGGIVLDPFCGSGSTGKAAYKEGFQFIGIELEADYHAIARERIEAELARFPLFQEAPA